MSDTSIRAIVASAGAGKTTAIVGAIAAEVITRDPEKILATTFTVKAADELIERSRAKLFKDGRAKEASRLLGARFGTVNSVCGQLVADYALSLGRSPRSKVLSETAAHRAFAMASDIAIGAHAANLNTLSERFGDLEPKRGDAEAFDWRTDVRKIIGLARTNGIEAGALDACAQRSVESFTALLPRGVASASQLDTALLDAVSAAVQDLPETLSATAKSSAETLRKSLSALQKGHVLNWPDWVRLSKIKCAKKDGPNLVASMGSVMEVAVRQAEHPRLREDCEAFIRGIFACAAEALESYQLFKSQRGLLDFVDQEALALQVLGDPACAQDIGERVSRVFVDEFQDSSPLQIAVFSKLAQIVEASTWVGDPKQAIYGFRAADCDLAMAAFRGVRANTGGSGEVLSKSYRSRRQIVEFVNAVFEPAMRRMALDPDEHKFSDAPRGDAGIAGDALNVWWLEGKLELQFAALAQRVKRMLDIDGRWSVGEGENATRPARAGDVALLCRSSADIERAAAAFAAAGVKVAVERKGLIQTLHVQLVLAAFRYLTDPSDTLALAELARFLTDDATSSQWLDVAIALDNAARVEVVPLAAQIDSLRETAAGLTMPEALDAIITLSQIRSRLEAWGDFEMRLEDIEALRGNAQQFEDSCKGSGVPATFSGFLLFATREQPGRPPSLGQDAVKIMTYHAAKGLEWPIVIMSGLTKESRPRIFEAVGETDGQLDWQAPLEGRWIRYWPWPYGAQKIGVGLDERAGQSELGCIAADKARDEDARLAYVGMTRARDHLIFAPPATGELGWFLTLADNPEHLVLPKDPGSIMAGGTPFTAQVEFLTASGDATEPAPRRATYSAPPRVSVPRLPLMRRPSSETAMDCYEIIERIDLGPRLPLLGRPDMQLLGEAFHAILAVDEKYESHEDRINRADEILRRWAVVGLAPQDAVIACDRLWSHLDVAWSDAGIVREVPVTAAIDDQVVSGRIDMLVQSPEEFAIVDHKSFPGSRDHWDAKACAYGAQLGMYSRAVATASGRSCAGLYIHMPIVGALLRVAAKT